ncbi:hypothetical protein K7432_012075 [Basidiobolus ranarum]|uniref:Gfo/Idh/MocA family oxidoreductase n=1 Tax=Basidiobolus ranarum TaxID=34480 RepID=A0ABR2WLH9_9FUNG
MSKKLNVLIIGTGLFATSTYLPALEGLSDKFQIVACCNRSLEKAQLFAEKASIPANAVYTDIDEALQHPGVDVAAILVPVQYNLEITRKAINAGKHVVLEKPIAHNLRDAAEVVRLSKSTDKVVLVAENFGYREYLHKVSNIIKNGTIGNGVAFNYVANRNYDPSNPYMATKWRQSPEHVGGYLSDGGVHNWAEIIELLGRPDEVSAFTSQTYEIHGAEDTIALSAKMVSGAVGTFVLSMATAKPAGLNFHIYGTKGTIYISQSQNIDTEGSISSEEISVTIFEDTGNVTNFDKSSGIGVTEEWCDFYDAVTHGKSLRITPEDAYYHLATIAAGIESSKTRKVVPVQTV